MNAKILNLPVELLSLVFEHHQSQTLEEPDGQLAEIVVSHVCATWRSIAMGHPKLWSWYSYRHEKRHEQEFERLVVYLERSFNHLLYLWFLLKYLPGRRDCYRTQESRAISLFQKAIEHAHRWRCISINIVGEAHFDERYSSIFAPLQTQNLSLPELETFEVCLPCLSSEAYLGDLFSSEQIAPKLCFVRMDPFGFLHYNPPHSITTLELYWGYTYDLPMPELLEALWDIMASPTLRTVSIVGEMIDYDGCIEEFMTGKRERLSTSIQNVRCTSPDFLNIICRHVQFPRLEMLCMWGIDLWDVFGDGEPITPALKIFPRLQTLIILNCEGDLESSISSLSQYTQGIKDLFIVQDPISVEDDLWDRPVFSAMLDEKAFSHCTLWPDLDTITLACSVDYEIPPEQVASCIHIAQIRQKKCILRVPRYNAERWESVNPTLWSSFSATGKLEIIPADANNSIGSWLPWPSQERQGIKPPSHIYNGDSFWRPIDEH